MNWITILPEMENSEFNGQRYRIVNIRETAATRFSSDLACA